MKQEGDLHPFNLAWISLDEVHTLDAEVEADKHFTYPIEGGVGVGTTNLLETSDGIHVYAVNNRFESTATRPPFVKSHFQGSYNSDALTISVAFGSTVKHQEYMPEQSLTFGGKNTLFRHAKQFEFDSVVDTNKPLDTFGFSIPITSLNLLIGKENAEYLLSKLMIPTTNSVVSIPIPLRITKILKAVISPHLKGRMKQLYSQTKVLEYLCELFEYVEQNESLQIEDREQTLTAQDVYEHLEGLKGTLPTLPELAEWAGISAKRLNTKFKKEFGVTLYRFLTKKRLEEAHLAIEKTQLPMKVLAAQLGYSHVNHFITAFKREFGYTPGSLRRK